MSDDTIKKETISIQLTPEAEAHPLSELAGGELMKIIALTMAKHPIRSYMPEIIERLVDGGVLMLETKETDAEDEDFGEATHD